MFVKNKYVSSTGAWKQAMQVLLLNILESQLQTLNSQIGSDSCIAEDSANPNDKLELFVAKLD